MTLLGGLTDYQIGGAISVSVVEFARGRLGFFPDPQQAELLESSSQQVILNCTRQWGKSTVAAVRAVHLAVTRPASLILVTAPSERQSGEFLKKAATFLDLCATYRRGDGVNRLSLVLENGSRIVAVPSTEATTRGFSAVNLLIIDEAAYTPDSLYIALRPMLAVSGGDVWLLSTPRGKRGFFYKTWTKGGAGWYRLRVAAADCPRIQEAFLARERGVMSESEYKQEYGCEFTTGDNFIFDRDLIEGCVSDDEHAWKDRP